MKKKEAGQKRSRTRRSATGQILRSQKFTREVGEILIRTTPDALIAIAVDGTVLFWSPGAENVFGYTQNEAVGRFLYELIVPPGLVEEWRNETREATENGVVVYQTSRRRKDGSVIHVDVTTKAVRDDKGRLQFIAVSQKDVSQIKVLNQRRTLDMRFRGLLELVPDATVVVNDIGRVVLANGQAKELFGYQQDELLGKPIEILLPERFRKGHVGYRTGYFSGPKTRTMGVGLELFACRRDGTEFPVEISLSPLQMGDDTFAMSAIRDITLQKKLQEELRAKNDELEAQNQRVQQANRLKSEFLANMSHELRTPLNGIIGFAEIMHDGRVGPISGEHKEYLGDILASARHLLQLINDILDLSKVEAGKMEFNPEAVNLPILVDEVREIVRTLAGKKRIEVKNEFDPALLAVEADPRSLKQILYNYLSNALKFTPDDGSVTIRVKPEDARHFRIEVEDNGIGIKSEDLSRLFFEFQQLDAGSTKKYSGTGLGLALTKKIVEAQQGRVGVSSTPGKGSVFYAILPRAFPMAMAMQEERKPFPAHPGAPLILVVEDDASDRVLIADGLANVGYAVETVATGAEALVRCREKRFDAITLDMMLPDMSGRAVLEKLRERGLNQQTPVVVVTLLANKGVVAGFEVADILPKPVSGNEILKTLKRCGVEPTTPRPILVVDDDEAALKLADQVLRQLGYRPVCRQDAASALRAALEERPAAIVLDLVMPEINGFEFLKRLRRTRRGRLTPVIVWTGKDLTESERRQLRSSARSVVPKSDAAEDLIREVNNCFLNRAARSPRQESL
jgi:PAS domain S-box-containing protein